MAKSIVKSIISSRKISCQLSSQLCDQKKFSSQLSSQLFCFKHFFFNCRLLWVLVGYCKNEPIMVKYGQSKVLLVHVSCFLVHLNVFFVCEILVNYMSILKYFRSFVSQFFYKNCFIKSIICSIFIGSKMSRQLFTQLLLEVKCQGNYFLNYYFKWFSQVQFWVESRSKPRLPGRGSVKGLDSSL